jgi:hypothetical protein
MQFRLSLIAETAGQDPGMPDIDLNSRSLDDLKKLQKNVGKAIAGFEAR